MKIISKSCFIVLLLSVIGVSCTKKSDHTGPAISFYHGSGYTDTVCTVATGNNLQIRIIAKSGDAAITNLVVTMFTPGGNEKALDSGLYTHQLDYTKHIVYGGEKYEKWVFWIRDKNGMTASTSMMIYKDSNSSYGQILYFPSVRLGLQENLLTGNFFDFVSSKIIKKDSASLYQQDIYLFSYLGDVLSPPTGVTLSSPNETDAPTFYSILSSWTAPKNETRFKPDSLSISSTEFDASGNDSLIIFNYTGATVGKRKCKMLKAGYVIPFEITVGKLSGKKGLIKVLSLNAAKDGYITIDIKIQK